MHRIQSANTRYTSRLWSDATWRSSDEDNVSRYRTHLNIESPTRPRALPRKLDKSDDGTGIFSLDRDFPASCNGMCEFRIELCVCGGLNGGKRLARRRIPIHGGQITFRAELASARARESKSTHRACLQVQYRTQRRRASSLSSVGPPGSRDGTTVQATSDQPR